MYPFGDGASSLTGRRGGGGGERALHVYFFTRPSHGIDYEFATKSAHDFAPMQDNPQGFNEELLRICKDNVTEG